MEILGLFGMDFDTVVVEFTFIQISCGHTVSNFENNESFFFFSEKFDVC